MTERWYSVDEIAAHAWASGATQSTGGSNGKGFRRTASGSSGSSRSPRWTNGYAPVPLLTAQTAPRVAKGRSNDRDRIPRSESARTPTTSTVHEQLAPGVVMRVALREFGLDEDIILENDGGGS